MKSSPVNVIRVLIADDHPVVREGLAAILRSEPDIQVVAEATDGVHACSLYDQHLPDVVILDLRMPRKDGLQVVTDLMSSRRPKPRIIVMTTYETEDDVRRALQAGARSYLVKGALPEQILETVRRVAAGEALVPSKIATVLTESLGHPDLSPRELQVLRRLAAGNSNKEIGDMLQITEHTVKAHVKAILLKLGAVGRTEAIAIAMKRGLLRES
jgi:two-component system, NarL family, response regulator